MLISCWGFVRTFSKHQYDQDKDDQKFVKLYLAQIYSVLSEEQSLVSWLSVQEVTCSITGENIIPSVPSQSIWYDPFGEGYFINIRKRTPPNNQQHSSNVLVKIDNLNFRHAGYIRNIICVYLELQSDNKQATIKRSEQRRINEQ